MSAVARVGDEHLCYMFEGVKPHKGGPILTGTLSVMIGGRPVATVGSTCLCVGLPDTVTAGSTSVFAGGEPVARLGDRCAHGGLITSGDSSVQVG